MRMEADNARDFTLFSVLYCSQHQIYALQNCHETPITALLLIRVVQLVKLSLAMEI